MEPIRLSDAPRIAPRVTADDIRAHVVARYLTPARQAGQEKFLVRAGDIMRDFKTITGVSHVCSALRAREFQIDNHLQLVAERGPRVGYNTVLEFAFLAHGNVTAAEPRSGTRPSAALRLLELYGSGADLFRRHGGGDVVLDRVREGWSE